MFFLAEYINMVTVSALAATLFLGGWRAPWGVHALWAGCNSGWAPLIWFVGKVVIGIFIFIWLRGTLPRLRYDQFMAFGWKVLIPINLIWILAVTSIHVLRDHGWPAWKATTVPLAIVLIVLAISVIVAEPAAARRVAERKAEDDEAEAMEPTFPIPPLDLVVPTAPQRIAATVGGPALLEKRSTDGGDD